jgi:hypothetical protein
MRLDHFRDMVERMAAEVPPDYMVGVAAIEVSPKSLPDPVRAGVYTMGEWIPFDIGSDEVVSRVVLYHGSFLELSRERPDFDWRDEAWETLLHELRHHLESKARATELESYDWAVEQNFARLDRQPFDALFYRSGEVVTEDVYRVDDDVFIERVVRELPPVVEVHWHGARYAAPVPEGALPLYLALDGLAHPPSGDVLVVFRRKPSLWDLFRPTPAVIQVRAHAESVS